MQVRRNRNARPRSFVQSLKSSFRSAVPRLARSRVGELHGASSSGQIISGFRNGRATAYIVPTATYVPCLHTIPFDRIYLKSPRHAQWTTHQIYIYFHRGFQSSLKSVEARNILNEMRFQFGVALGHACSTETCAMVRPVKKNKTTKRKTETRAIGRKITGPASSVFCIRNYKSYLSLYS